MVRDISRRVGTAFSKARGAEVVLKGGDHAEGRQVEGLGPEGWAPTVGLDHSGLEATSFPDPLCN